MGIRRQVRRRRAGISERFENLPVACRRLKARAVLAALAVPPGTRRVNADAVMPLVPTIPRFKIFSIRELDQIDVSIRSRCSLATGKKSRSHTRIL